MKKILSVFLLICLVVCSFASCNEKETSSSKDESVVSENSVQSEASQSEESSAEVSENESSAEEQSEELNEESSESKSEESSEESIEDIIASLGANVSYDELPKIDLNNREIFIIERWFGYGKQTIDFTGEVLYMENEDGELSVANQAKKEIMEKVQKDYNCKITGWIFGDGSANIVGDLKTLVHTDITAGTGKYDMLFETPYYYTNFVSDGFFCDANEISTLNLKSTCWDQNALKDLSIKNMNFFLYGDINTYDNAGTVAMLFNKELYALRGYEEDLYALVREGKWTFDKLLELSASYKNFDNNQDGKRNEFDEWFMGSDTTNLYAHVIAAGEGICGKNEKDVPTLSMNTKTTIDSLTDAVNFYTSGKVLVANLPEYYEKYPLYGQAYEMTVINSFLEGREIFFMTTLDKLKYYRYMDNEFGILPVPMYTATQGRYYSPVDIVNTSSLMIPRGVNADNNLGVVIQALAELSEEVLKPAYYAEQLVFRDFIDVASVETLEIIFKSRHFDLGAVFGASWSNADQLYGILDTNIEDRFEEKEYLIQALIEATMEDIEDAYIH